MLVYVYILSSISNLGALFKVQGSPLHWFINHSFHIQNFPGCQLLHPSENRTLPSTALRSRGTEFCNWSIMYSASLWVMLITWRAAWWRKITGSDHHPCLYEKKIPGEAYWLSFQELLPNATKKTDLDMRKPTRHQFLLTWKISFTARPLKKLALWITS